MLRRQSARLTLLFICLTSLAACGGPFGGKYSTIGSGHDPGLPTDASGTPLPVAKGTEFVAGSTQNKPTQNGTHQISATLDSPASGLKLSTTAGKILYSNVQGEILSQ